MTEIATSIPLNLPPYYSTQRPRNLGEVQDRLGWDCMVEGRIPSLFVRHQRTRLAHAETRMTAKRWARGLIQKLLQMTHKQWLLRNARVHIKRKGDLTEEEHDKLLQKIERMMWIDPENLLREDRHLLEEDCDALYKASALDQQLWVAEMEASLSAAEYTAPARNRCTDNADHDLNHDTIGMAEPIDLTNELGSEGSGAWQKERWR